MQVSCPLQGCHYSATGSNEADVMKQLAEHQREAHGVKEIGEDMRTRVGGRLK